MSSPAPPIRVGRLGLSPATAGSLCCVVSVLGYSATSICLRRLAELGCDPTWAICNKELVSVLLVGPWLLAQSLRGLRALPRGRPLALLITVGLATQLGGNAGVQWAYGVVGMVFMVPAVFAFMLTASAVLSRMVLGEHLSARSLGAIGLLLASLALLGLGAESTGASAVGEGLAGGPAAVAAAIAIACVAGIIYALLSIAIRHCVTGTTPLGAVVLIITGMGVISLGPLSWLRVGLPGLLATPPEQLAWMTTAGLCNLVAFIAQTRGLQLITAIHVNMLSSAQVALAAVSGFVLFHEALNRWLLLGVVLTIVGIFLFGRPTAEPAVDQHV